MTEKKVDLKINVLSQSTFDSLTEIPSEELFLVKSEGLDAEGYRIINVSDPIEDTDSANKAYVDSKGLSKEVVEELNRKYEELSNFSIQVPSEIQTVPLLDESSTSLDIINKINTIIEVLNGLNIVNKE